MRSTPFIGSLSLGFGVSARLLLLSGLVAVGGLIEGVWPRPHVFLVVCRRLFTGFEGFGVMSVRSCSDDVLERHRRLSAYIGSRIRFWRLRCGWTQAALGEAIGVKFQQVQKYEMGSNRVSAPILYSLSEVLEVPVSAFFDGFEGRGVSEGTPAALDASSMQGRQLLNLINFYNRIGDAEGRHMVLAVAKREAGR